MANFNETDNFDDMYNEPPDFVAGFSGPHGLKRKASLDWNSYQSTSTSATGSSSRQFPSASTAETASHEISALDIKRRAVLVINFKTDNLFIDLKELKSLKLNYIFKSFEGLLLKSIKCRLRFKIQENALDC
jgi:hypothetical protein